MNILNWKWVGKFWVINLLFVGVIFGNIGCPPTEPTGEPKITLTHIPAYGSTENLRGKVSGVVVADHQIAVYIKVANGWWTKPYFSSPLTSINRSGRWTCDVTTGGDDVHAISYAAYLLPKGVEPPSCGCSELPDIPEAVAFTRYDRFPNEDDIPPVIEMANGNPITIEVGGVYIDPGASAVDNHDGALAVTVQNNVETSVVGTYYVIYTVTDSSGNMATATREVHVVDTTLPVITIVGGNPINIQVGLTYNDAGATAWDNYNGDLTANITVVNNVNAAAVGNYTVVYSVSDSSGNTASATRVVNVTPISDEKEIFFDSWPEYGTSGYLSGHVTGVNPTDFMIAVYIKVEEVWWTKPFFAWPLTTINTDGTWSCYVVTGGNDAYATEFAAYLLPVGIDPPSCGPCYELPTIPESVAFNSLERTPPMREISFAGRVWQVKRADFRAGPGPNYFSDRAEDVWADDDGLHLTIKNRNGWWYCTEVILNESLGYGTYLIQTNSRVDILDPNIVLGEFTWDTSARDAYFREIDIEYAKWGNSAIDTNAQYVVQPCSVCPGCSNCTRFQVDLTDQNAYLTSYIIWQEGRVEFRTYYGQYAIGDIPPADDLIHSWVVEGSDVPAAGDENFRFNLWLVNGSAPLNEQDEEVVISDFAWQSDALIFDEAPTIFVLGSDPVTLEVGTPYFDAGATADDGEDGDLTPEVIATSNVNTAVLGVYTVIYAVTDSAENTATATRTVNVVDTTPPTITILGANPMTVSVGSNYVDPGATAYDNYEGDLTDQIVVSKDADTPVATSSGLLLMLMFCPTKPRVPTGRSR